MNMKHKVRSILAVITLLTTIVAMGALTASAETVGSTIVTYTTSGSDVPKDTFEMHVCIEGNGSVFDGEQELFGSNHAYLLKPGQEKTFRVPEKSIPNLVRIIFNDEDITKQMNSNGYINVQGLEKDTKLVFTFQENGKPNDDNYNDNTNNIKTGDNHIVDMLIILASISGGAVICFYVVRKKSK